ncbi:fatty acyl-AMP ligase [Amycolatopsis sp. NPDC051071]|uniref:fatty acyl-AMP ligase n=1 Tax=Amycolatopsis sp. NPDC051071 TaxID=3154637 RepID=UPI003420C2C5
MTSLATPETSTVRTSGTVIDLLSAAARRHPDQTAVIHVEDPAAAEPAGSLTYGELHHAARRVAALLASGTRPGDRVLVLCQDGPNFLTAYLGCLYAGVIAVPAPAPGGYRQHSERLAHIATDAGAVAAITTIEKLSTVAGWAAEALPGPLWCLAADAVDLPPATAWSRPGVDTETIAMLQYTSGSTTDPKGILITHGNLIANAAAQHRALGGRQNVRFGGWTPLYHDMGFSIVMLPLLMGGSSVVMAPTTFLKRPLAWLQMIDRYRVRLSAGPDFAYRLCLRKVTDEQLSTLDLSGWRSALNGAEPINPATLRDFQRRFAVTGFGESAPCPVYGLAEATVYVTGISDRAPDVRLVDAAMLERGRFVPTDDRGKGREIVSCGTVTDFELRITDPVTGAVLPPGHAGEIRLRGASIGKGYWAHRGERGFADEGFLHTGDLGVSYDDQLFVLGRLDEVIRLGDRILLPQQIEQEIRIELGDAVELGAAVSTGRDDLVLLQEVRGRPDEHDLAKIADRIRQRLRMALDVTADRVVLLRRGSVLRTTSGKTRRVAMREQFLDGGLRVMHDDPTPDSFR